MGLALVLACAACGDWVRFDNGGQGQSTPIGGATGEFDEVDRLSHVLFGDLMRRFVVAPTESEPTALFDYLAFDADPEARHALESYLSALAAIDPSQLDGAEQRLAYWINGYNASAIRGVVSKFDGDRGFKAVDGPFFSELIYRFGNVPMSLDQLEHGVLRGDAAHGSLRTTDAETKALFARWRDELWGDGDFDPRVHAVLNCTALSCPDLIHGEPFVYRADLIDQQLEDATRAWLADPARGAGPEGISKLFEWFAADFEAAAGGNEAFIAAHREGGLDGVDANTILEYDWTLNIAPAP